MELTIIIIVSFVVALLLVVLTVKICLRFNICQCCDKDTDSLADSLDNDDILDGELDDENGTSDCEDNDIGSLHLEDEDTITHISDQTHLYDLDSGEEINTGHFNDTQMKTNQCTNTTNGNQYESLSKQSQKKSQLQETHPLSADNHVINKYPGTLQKIQGPPNSSISQRSKSTSAYEGHDLMTNSQSETTEQVTRFPPLLNKSNCPRDSDTGGINQTLINTPAEDSSCSPNMVASSVQNFHYTQLQSDRNTGNISHLKTSTVVMTNPAFEMSNHVTSKSGSSLAT